ncbi:class I SAM-dependent methyltransferase [Xylanimonas protaetiae]|uniref:Methyltransferase domain-containing protein n=1 Tax=Xylanimonas protaetiae TaxID=2509457 RepID=A0A4P6F4T3_9MICO|nr:methyltransferase domain-containing protein [Xylanimonas protaetiae]QAY70672.1 methyltransferase domain-containing protein [Xylanimonas protaetiae]
MDPTQAVRERFDGRAPEYDDSTMHRALASAVAEFVDLDGVRDVLDAGTGTGLVEGDATAPPFPDGSFDLVTCVTALHLMPDGDAALAAWVRALRPGGRVVLATFAGFDPAHHHRHGATPPAYPVHHDRYDSVEKVHGVATAAGLRVTRHATWTHGDEGVLLTELGL